MRIIETKAPLELDQLKEYFTDKNIFYLIDYEQSDIKGEMLLTYLSNLEIPCDLQIKEYDNCMTLLSTYLSFKQILSVPFLEQKTIDVLLQYKGIIEISDHEFIETHADILQVWVEKLDSLSIFNMWIVNEESFKDFAEQFPHDDKDSIEGINFVSLLKHEEFYIYYNIVDKTNLKFYERYFEDYMFKGNNLYSYWANENNPMFLLNWAISSGNLDLEEYSKAIKEEVKELKEIVSFSR